MLTMHQGTVRFCLLAKGPEGSDFNKKNLARVEVATELPNLNFRVIPVTPLVRDARSELLHQTDCITWSHGVAKFNRRIDHAFKISIN